MEINEILCPCHCHNDHEGAGLSNPEVHCKCIPNCEHCNSLTAEREKWEDYDYANDPIFGLLYWHLIDASEVRHGCAFIGKDEARSLTIQIRQILEKTS